MGLGVGEDEEGDDDPNPEVADSKVIPIFQVDFYLVPVASASAYQDFSSFFNLPGQHLLGGGYLDEYRAVAGPVWVHLGQRRGSPRSQAHLLSLFKNQGQHLSGGGNVAVY